MDALAPLTAKGQQTRARILDAAHQAIAELGVAGVSHRAIAQRAGVKLSLTSYYFGSLDQLLEAVWDAQRARSAVLSDALREGSTQLSEALRACAAPGERAMLVERLASHFARYIAQEAVERPGDLAVDCSFLFAWTLPETLRAKVVAHNQLWVDRTLLMMQLVGSDDPGTDAATLVAAVRHAEFALVTYGRDSLSEAAMARRFARLLRGMVPNLAAAP